MKKNILYSLLAAAGVVAAVVVAVIVINSSQDMSAFEDDGEEVRQKLIDSTDQTVKKDDLKKKKREKASANTNAQTVRREKPVRKTSAEEIEEREDLSAEEKKLMLDIENALDKEDLEALLATIEDVKVSTNTEIRSDFVDALAWFGKKGMLELLPFMADRDEDVAQSAIDAWTSSLSEISNEQTKANYVEAASSVLMDEDALDQMMTELFDCEEPVAIQALVNIIEGGGTPKAIEVAKENYEFITSEEYTTVEAAENWLREYAAENAEMEMEGDGEGAGAGK